MSQSRINISKINHTALKHVVQNMTPHEFALIRGIASNFLKKSHPLDTHIKKHLGGSFKFPDDANLNAMKDILKSQSPHKLAEMIHDEEMDIKGGMILSGGGIGSSVKSVLKKGLSGSHKIIKGSVTVSRSLNAMLERGLIIAHTLEPLVNIVDPSMGKSFSSAVAGAQRIQESLGNAIKGADTIHDVLHGKMDKMT